MSEHRSRGWRASVAVPAGHSWAWLTGVLALAAALETLVTGTVVSGKRATGERGLPERCAQPALAWRLTACSWP